MMLLLLPPPPPLPLPLQEVAALLDAAPLVLFVNLFV